MVCFYILLKMFKKIHWQGKPCKIKVVSVHHISANSLIEQIQT